MKKYVCIGTKKIEAEWLPRFYKIPHDECVFSRYNKLFKQNEPHSEKGLIELTPLPKGTDYVQYLKILKTERLLDGDDVRGY